MIEVVACLPLLAVGALLVDAILRRRLPDTPEIEWEYGAGDVTFVLLPATQVRTKPLMARIAKLLLKYGNVLTADGAKLRFNARSITNRVFGRIRNERRIVLVAPSSGLMLAFDIAACLEAMCDDETDISILPIDGLPSHIYLKAKGLGVARFLPLGPICNLFTSLVWRFAFKPELSVQDKLGRRDKWNLRRLWRSYHSYPLSAWRDQLMFIIGWKNNTILRKTRCVYIRSENDELISDAAIPACSMMTDGKLIDVITVPGMGHLRLLDRPDLYEEALVRGLELLEIERVV